MSLALLNPPSLQTKTPYLSFDEALALFDVVPVIAVDTETNGYDIRDGRGFAYGISVASRIPGVGVVSAYLPFRNKPEPDGTSLNLGVVELAQLKDKIENFKGYLIFHNAKFDLESLRTLGIYYTGKFFCTMQLAHIINENFPFKKSLDECAKFYLDGSSKKESESFKLWLKIYGWEGMIVSIISEYACYDAELAFRLWEVLWNRYLKEVPPEYWEKKQEVYPVWQTMERRGILINKQLCNRMIVHGTMAMEDIVELLGDRNPGSPKVLKELLIDELGLPVIKTSEKTGAPSFDKEAMAVYDQILERQSNPIAEYILAYRGWQKSVTSNYKPYLDLLSPDGRLRPNYKLHGTKTGRSSCELPNLQQIPKLSNKPWNGDMKNAFIPMPGYRLWEADYAQLELRLGAAYAKETTLLEIFEAGRDVFTEMSVKLGMLRFDTKTLTYTIQYGGGINRIHQVFGVSKERAAEIREGYFNTYPGFRAVSDYASRKARYKGKLQLWSKRYRHFINPKKEAHKAFNSVIQGGAADIVERTMVRLFNMVDHEDECRMLLMVHDSIVFEIKEGLEDKYLPLIKEVMEAVEPDFGVRFVVDIHEWGVVS